jgi:hypothetical protein
LGWGGIGGEVGGWSLEVGFGAVLVMWVFGRLRRWLCVGSEVGWEGY